MTIKVGDKVPQVTLRNLTPEGIKEITPDELFGGKKVVLFAVPGAYTRTCSQRHLPSYVGNAAALKAKGVDTIACIAVNDAFVMGAWGKEHGAGDRSEEHTSELQSHLNLVCRLLLEKKKQTPPSTLTA